jgi:hypothetical protein
LAGARLSPVVTPETDPLEAKLEQLRLAIEADIREVRGARRQLDSTLAWLVVSRVARVGLLGLVLVLVAGLLGLSSGVLAGTAAVALGVAVLVLEQPGGRGA